MEFDITKMVEEIAMQAKENQEEFIFETIRPYCENVLQMKINKEELKQILLSSIQKQQPCEDTISRQAVINRIANTCFWLSADNWKELIKCINSISTVTPAEKQPLCEDTLEKIRAEILDEAEYAYADFDEYKYHILHAEPDELPDDDFRYGMERAVEIINKYRKDGAE